MKKHNGKKGMGSKHQHKSAARFKSLFLKKNEAGIERIHIPLENKPATKQKAMVHELKEAMPHTQEELISTDMSPKRVKGKAAKKAAKKAKRSKAEVIPIGRNRVDREKQLAAEADSIAKLEAIVAADKKSSNDQGAFVGPVFKDIKDMPKQDSSAWMPPLKTPVAKVEAIGKATPTAAPVVENKDEAWVKLYGSCIRDTGVGMTPSGIKISEFEVGGKYAPTGTMRTDCWELLHSVTSKASDYTYEELAELNDLLQLEALEMKTDYERRLSERDAIIDEQSKALDVKGFNQAHSGDISAAITELQDENTSLTVRNDELNVEVERVMASNDMLMSHAAKQSESVKPALKTLANLYNIYASQHNSNPLRSFLRQGGYGFSREAELREHFDNDCEHRLFLNEERKVHRKWASKEYKRLRWACRTREEIKALRRIAENAAILRPEPPVPEWLCKKLHSVTSDVDTGAKHVYDNRLRPLAGEVSKDAYCKVWSEFKSVMPRAEYEAWSVKQDKVAKLATLSKSKVFKAVLPVINAGKAISKAMSYELSASKRKELADYNIKQAEQASRIKREREAAFEKELGREDTLNKRKALNVKHAEENLVKGGFIL